MPRDFAAIQAELRKALAPPADHPDALDKTCVDCGAPFMDWSSKSRGYCADCGADRMRYRRKPAGRSTVR